MHRSLFGSALTRLWRQRRQIASSSIDPPSSTTVFVQPPHELQELDFRLRQVAKWRGLGKCEDELPGKNIRAKAHIVLVGLVAHRCERGADLARFHTNDFVARGP